MRSKTPIGVSLVGSRPLRPISVHSTLGTSLWGRTRPRYARLSSPNTLWTLLTTTWLEGPLLRQKRTMRSRMRQNAAVYGSV